MIALEIVSAIVSTIALEIVSAIVSTIALEIVSAIVSAIALAITSTKALATILATGKVTRIKPGFSPGELLRKLYGKVRLGPNAENPGAVSCKGTAGFTTWQPTSGRLESCLAGY